MKKLFLALIAFVLFCSHDMYLKLDTYFLKPNTSATIQLFNGTFDKSENVIDRDRMIDASLVDNGNRAKINLDQWSEKDSITILSFRTGESGTGVAGISTAPRTIEMTATDFNKYLEHDGVLDMLDWRRKNDALEVDAAEKYSKHVKAIFQVGDKKTEDWQTILGYPIEFVPLKNPYDLHTGDELQVKLLYHGEPLANQLVYANYKETGHGHSHDDEQENTKEHGHTHNKDKTNETKQAHSHSEDHDKSEEHGHSHSSEGDNVGKHDHSHGEGHSANGEHGHSHSNENGETEEDHQHTSGTQLRTDDNGNLTVKLTADGIWYLRTINLVQSEEPELTHESNWATLTFEVVHGHDETTHTHVDDHEEGISSYVYWIGSLILLLGLFFWFNRKR
ncbi:DUF4198 domain-containing protein [uncultured Kriegella sp.]|uniref:DUF4198 domain-containing protein n=1 Tax=uncultured Kriegella sp. TaxID=1798910 RepID=UPI0030D84341|tara:strand:- start:112199 stop:113374 length:1176 start_codon:yes stop_codon:yes gene_type:complete